MLHKNKFKKLEVKFDSGQVIKKFNRLKFSFKIWKLMGKILDIRFIFIYMAWNIGSFPPSS